MHCNDTFFVNSVFRGNVHLEFVSSEENVKYV